MTSLWKTRLFWACLLVFVLAVAAVLVQVFLPGPAVIETTDGDAHIYFLADRRAVFAPGDCVNLRWRVESIREVYLDIEPVVGEGSARWCVLRDAMPVLNVLLREGEELTAYRLSITFFVDQAASVVLIGLAALALLTALLVRIAPVSDGTTRRASRATASQSELPPADTQSGDARAARAVTGCLSAIGGLVLLLAVTGISLELILRFYFNTFGGQTERIRYTMSADEIRSVYQARLIPLPLVEYGLNPSYEGYNALGWRGPEIEVPKPDGVFRIVAMGASTTYGFTTPEESYPAQLQRTLRETYGYDQVEVVNAGVFGYTTFNTMVSLETRVLELEPDLVIIYHATNDVIPREYPPDCYRGINPLRGLDPRTRSASPDILNLGPSTLYRMLAVNAGWVQDPSGLESLFRDYALDCGGGGMSQASFVSREEAARNVPLNPPIYFERNLRTIVGITRVHNIRLMFSTWAYQESSSEALPFWRAAIDEHNAITRRLAGEYDLLFVDYAPQAVQTPEHWSDYIHMNSVGSRHQAETYAAYLDAAGILPAENP